MLNKNLALVILAFFAAGCGLEVRSYVMTKDRVGLNQTGGNGGCIMGKCAPPPPPTETTRKVYVLEITKPVPESEVQKIEQTAVNAIVDTQPSPDTTVPAQPSADNTPAAAPQDDNKAPLIPVIGDEPAASQPAAPQAASGGNGGFVQGQTYTVQKDDTLQKISKKVYGTYTKWYRIYKANKDKIANPNVLQPGTVLNIPALK